MNMGNTMLIAICTLLYTLVKKCLLLYTFANRCILLYTQPNGCCLGDVFVSGYFVPFVDNTSSLITPPHSQVFKSANGVFTVGGAAANPSTY